MQYTWHSVHQPKDLPKNGLRVLFEARSGFRFYGRRTGRETIEVLLTGRAISWLLIKMWAVDEVPENDGAEERGLRFTVLNARYEAMRPVALITNASASRLKSYLGERAFSRVCETAGIVLFTWGSFRGETIRHKNWEEGK